MSTRAQAIAVFVLALIPMGVFFVYGMPAEGDPRISPFTMFGLGAIFGSLATSGLRVLKEGGNSGSRGA